MGFFDSVAKWWADVTTPRNTGNDNTWVGDGGYVFDGSSTYGNSKPSSSSSRSSGGKGRSSAKVRNSSPTEGANQWVGDGGHVFDGTAAYGSDNVANDIVDTAKSAASSVGKAIDESFFPAPKTASSQPRYWDETSPDYDPAQSFLGPEIMPSTQRQDRAADKASYDQYMAYYNDKAANPEQYDDSRVSTDYLVSYLPGNGGGEQLVDNGTNSYLNRTSNFITGSEAKKQAEYFGNDKLTEALTDVGDNEIISKNSLQQFGYRPFTDTSNIKDYIGGKLSQGISAIGEASEQLWNTASNARNDLSDWSVKLFDTEFSGKEIDKAIHDARDKGAGAYDEDGNWMPSGVKIDPAMATQREDGLWVAPASDGNKYVIDAQKFDSGGYTLRYQDAVVKDKDGKEQHIPMEYWADVTKDYSVAEFLAAVYYPELGLGEKEEKAAEMYEDMGSATDYGPANINAPSYKSDNVLSEYAVPSLVNGALSSLAYLNPYTLAERASMAEVLSASGLNATSQQIRKIGQSDEKKDNESDDGNILTKIFNNKNPDPYIRTYQPATDNFLNTTMGVLAPIAESKLGSLGNFGGKGFLEKGAESIMTKIPGIGGTWAGRELIPAATSEGLEEVIVDPIYALQESGTGAYADQAKNDQGLLAFDEYNRPIYENTDIAQRARNYIQDQPNNFVMGAAMGGGIRTGARALQHVTKAGRQQLAEEKSDRDFFNQYVRQMGGAFTRDEVGALRRQAGAVNNIADSFDPNEKVPFTVQEFEEMLRNMRAVEEMDDEDTLDAQVKRNVR